MRNFLTLTKLGGFTRVFRESCDLLAAAVSKNMFSSKKELFFLFSALAGPRLRMAQTNRYKRFFPTGCPFSHILEDFGLCVSSDKGSKIVKNDFLQKQYWTIWGVFRGAFSLF